MGQRGYFATRQFLLHGFDAVNVSGGFKSFMQVGGGVAGGGPNGGREGGQGEVKGGWAEPHEGAAGQAHSNRAEGVGWG